MRCTEKELKFMRYIDEYWVEHEQGPTSAEIRKAMGGHPAWTLDILGARAMLSRVPGSNRTVSVTDKGHDELDKSVLRSD